MKTCFVVNLHSGKRPHLARRAIRFARDHHHACWVTERRLHARDLARAACEQGFECVVAVGGDGTMNEVASGLLGTNVALGLVPAGSGNGLARHLGIFGSERHIFATLHSGIVGEIDAGFANDVPFFTVAGVGFEAEISGRFGEHQRGFGGYLRSAVRRIATYPKKHYNVHLGGETISLAALTIAVANASQYGNGARIAPEARTDDGLLDIVAIPPVSIFSAPQFLGALFFGNLSRMRGVWSRQSDAATISSPDAFSFHTDGECHPPTTRVVFRLQPGGLKILLPAPAKGP